ncbi:MAG: type II secretion system protein N [Desulfobacterales bacterium]|nr:type II secretion system protein N [Desulfobacterales bacterium]
MIKQGVTLCNLILITAAIYIAVAGFYKIAAVRLDTGGESEIALTQPAGLKPEPHLPLSRYRTIAQRNLFKLETETEKKTPPGPAPAVNIDALKQTDLKLKLWGTATGKNIQPYAVIELLKERKQNLFRQGDAVENATVKIILKGKVILSVNGTDEILEMDPSEEKKTAPARQAAPEPASQEISLKRTDIAQAIQNPNDFLNQVRIRPHLKDGQPDGLALIDVKSDSIFTKIGLRRGDIIKGINGQEIRTVRDAIGLYEELGTASRLSVQILRRGRSQLLNYTIE